MTERSDNHSFDRERQIERARVLVELLSAADDADLPPMDWTVWSAPGSALHGEVGGGRDQDPQVTFEAWMRLLGLRVASRGDRASGYFLGVAVGIELGQKEAGR